jgi:hypothetical protein
MPPEEHSRVCQYANSALETLLAKARHAEQCRQCRIDSKFCHTSADYDQSFARDYDNWLANRQKGGVLSRGPSLDSSLRTVLP